MVEQRSPKPRVGGSSPSAPAIYLKEHNQKVYFMANPFTKVRQFYRETLVELKKANWPKSGEIRSSMIMVFVSILLLGAFIAIADFSVYNVVSLCTALVSGN